MKKLSIAIALVLGMQGAEAAKMCKKEPSYQVANTQWVYGIGCGNKVLMENELPAGQICQIEYFRGNGKRTNVPCSPGDMKTEAESGTHGSGYAIWCRLQKSGKYVCMWDYNGISQSLGAAVCAYGDKGIMADETFLMRLIAARLAE